MAHALKFDPSTAEGARIVALYNKIKAEIEDDEGGWDGADIVDALCEWFTGLGVDVSPDGELISAT
ncbi:hypothetical protein ABZ454_38730 [Streptomyces sp. NPDC005803]|uniref:hypothetical protein n=1 Tax=Streptomyces sp. NPDC005803 TaxID=3154297 RepID=UPI003403252E